MLATRTLFVSLFFLSACADEVDLWGDSLAPDLREDSTAEAVVELVNTVGLKEPSQLYALSAKLMVVLGDHERPVRRT